MTRQIPPGPTPSSIDPESVRRRTETVLDENGTWIDGMEIDELATVVRTRHQVGGATHYTTHVIYPLGPVDPDVLPSMLRKVLRSVESPDQPLW